MRKRIPPVVIKCEVCGNDFSVPASQLNHRTPRFCSRGCMKIGFSKPSAYVNLECEYCGKSMTKLKSHLTKHAYCSQRCAWDAKRVEGAKWRDPEYIKAYMAEYTRTHRAKHNEQSVDWHQNNPLYKKQWARENPLKVRAYHVSRRKKVLSLPSEFNDNDCSIMMAYWNGSCAYCGNPPGLLHSHRMTVDHFIPITSPECPGTVPTNLLPCCQSCNSSKNSSNPQEWVHRVFGSRRGKKLLLAIAEYFNTFMEVAA